MENLIESEIKVNNIYYENNDQLAIYPSSATERVLTINQAEKLLEKEKVSYTSVLKVRVSYEQIELPIEIFEKYKK